LTHNGAAIIDFCLRNNFIIADTNFPRDEFGTWRNPKERDVVYRNAVDHILVLQQQEKDGIDHLGIKNCGACLDSSCNTDAYNDHQ